MCKGAGLVSQLCPQWSGVRAPITQHTQHTNPLFSPLDICFRKAIDKP
ncbi:hypothetical protein HMPREF1991_00740 [Hoylesella loescheii DSM 19665 = JCM 12249 = ATCC 15930]|uniref:Uncharacterized protein n=1 Tax=Hoylesella loescheii DSM 19665 = JCM 12249 = ATCC 15930 TaxID=1122985 RepID=A0A069QMG7_HOYLO|nr:hypothetical protein HMPREF1991_00740 [Hoylesella loescheii DSM 19665 = JCM 12249 = ATCC 15930]